jgi:eukaryotic translation initiation factor 2C
MAGPSKRRAIAEKQPHQQGSSQGSSSASRDPTQRSTPQSISRLDGNRDPSLAATTGGVLDYTRPTDLKNISEFLGLAGWYVARGVSTNAFQFLFPFACSSDTNTARIHAANMQTGSS